ncbi:MAG: C40 family peptidase [Bacteroidales bacterium]|nr:C40 family peptidase [Bacteroidales bacterium]
MDTFVCCNVFVPLRSGPSHRSEMLSQVLFGEKYRIIDHVGHWYRIETLFDNYRGWIDTDHLQHSAAGQDDTGQVLNRSLPCHREDGTRMVLEAGCEVYDPDFEKGSFRAGNCTFSAAPDFNQSYLKASGSLADTALKFINSPYIWGGRIPSGIDCSGFVQLVYKIQGLKIPRDSRQQAEAGNSISFLEETLPGDLLLFDDESGKINHVGMLLSRGLVIHASGRVRIDIIDAQGIYKKEKKGYSHKLRTIRRITGE